MSTHKRVPAGTPASGQFAPRLAHRARSVPPSSHGRWDSAAALSQRLNDRYVQRDDVNADISRISARLLATQVAARYPTAATIVLDTYMSDDGNAAGIREVLDTEGTVLLRATDRFNTTAEEDNDLDDWYFTAAGIQLGGAHTADFLDDPEFQQGTAGWILESWHGRLDIGKALRLR